MVGHDWGGVLAWRFATLYPELVAEAGGPATGAAPRGVSRRAEAEPRQRLRSSDVLFFELPVVPELVLRGEFSPWLEPRPGVGSRSTQGHSSEADIASAQAGAGSARRPDRAAELLPGSRSRYADDLYGPPQLVQAPTLLIWGEQDPYLCLGLTEELERRVPDLRVDALPTRVTGYRTTCPIGSTGC